MIIEFVVEEAQAGVRLDRLVSERGSISRSRVQELIAQGRVTVNGSSCKSSYKAAAGDQIVLSYDDPEALDVEGAGHPAGYPL